MVAIDAMTGPELHRLIRGGVKTVVIPFGSVEQHGGHLPLGTDAILADVVGQAVADRLNAVLAPTVRVGCADRHMHRVGTLTMPADTLSAVAFHLARSLVMHGFRVIALVSTHGGNQLALEEAAREVNHEHQDVVACAPRGDAGPDPGAHSGKWLTSVMLAVRPYLVNAELADPGLVDELRAATAEEGADNLERFISSIVQQVRDVAERPAASQT